MSTFQKLFDLGNEIESLTASLTVESDETIGELNEAIELLESKDARIVELEASLAKNIELLHKQDVVIASSIVVKQKDNASLNLLRAQNQEYQSLDPKRLAKVNKANKASLIELKAKNKELDTARRAALKNNRIIGDSAKSNGSALFHMDPDSKNAMRVIPNLFVGKDNEYGGVPGSPVVEFIHNARGITRQGLLSTDGTIKWASASNSMPTPAESLIARARILEFCKQQNIKTAA
jgi:hypothetical protein